MLLLVIRTVWTICGGTHPFIWKIKKKSLTVIVWPGHPFSAKKNVTATLLLGTLIPPLNTKCDMKTLKYKKKSYKFLLG